MGRTANASRRDATFAAVTHTHTHTTQYARERLLDGEWGKNIAVETQRHLAKAAGDFQAGKNMAKTHSNKRILAVMRMSDHTIDTRNTKTRPDHGHKTQRIRTHEFRHRHNSKSDAIYESTRARSGQETDGLHTQVGLATDQLQWIWRHTSSAKDRHSTQQPQKIIITTTQKWRVIIIITFYDDLQTPTLVRILAFSKSSCRVPTPTDDRRTSRMHPVNSGQLARPLSARPT
eukprot:Opistho-2@92404